MTLPAEISRPKVLQLFVRGVTVTVIGVFGSMWLFPEHATLVSLFLAAVAAEDTVARILDWNRQVIYDESVTARRANGWLSISMLSLLLGCFLAFTGFASLLPWSEVDTLFDEQLSKRQFFPVMQFGNFRALFFHNIGVMVLFFIIALPFRQGGVMLAIVWNASVWGATVGTLARQWAEGRGPPFWQAVPRVATAILPHLALEGMGFVMAGMAGVS